MRKLPSFFSLRAFEAAARHLSFALAAEELHLTPSAISHQVRALEDYFGKLLFERSARHVRLSAAGQQLLSGVSRGFDLLESSCADLDLAAESSALALHCSPSFAATWLTPHLPHFMQAHPALNVRLTSDAEPIDLIQRAGIDVAIAYGAVKVQRPGVTIEALGTEIIAPLCSPRLLHQATTLTPGAMAGLTLIDSQLSPVTWEDWFALHGMPTPVKARPGFDRGALAISAAVSGMGVALESTRLARRELASGELIQLGRNEFAPLVREIHFLCYRAARADSDKIKQFRAWIFDQLGVTAR